LKGKGGVTGTLCPVVGREKYAILINDSFAEPVVLDASHRLGVLETVPLVRRIKEEEIVMATKKAIPASAKDSAKKNIAAKPAADTKPGAKKRGRPAKAK